jgi:hypothetical protein
MSVRLRSLVLAAVSLAVVFALETASFAQGQPEAASKEVLAAGLKRAKLSMTADEMIAKRNALSHLVSAEIWYHIDGIGPD